MFLPQPANTIRPCSPRFPCSISDGYNTRFFTLFIIGVPRTTKQEWLETSQQKIVFFAARCNGGAKKKLNVFQDLALGKFLAEK